MQLAEFLWRITGSFGAPGGETEQTQNGYRFDGGEYVIETTRETDRNGVCLQKSVFRNVSDHPLAVGCLMTRFLLPDGEYEAYTQTNIQLNESTGLWQPLHTGVFVRTPHMRRSYGAAPILALWNKQAERGTVYHLLANGAWEMSASRINGAVCKHRTIAEMGLDSQQTSLTVAPGQTLALPDVLFYDFTCKRDLDCYKLHGWLNRNMPRRELPILYNTWLYRFDMLTADGVLEQVGLAKELGADYFAVDAGWYGPKARWTTTRGDWEERDDGALEGRLSEISDAVRAAGMKFGFWMEAETASPTAAIVQAHPEYFFTRQNKVFLDYANAAARQYMIDTTVALVKKYHADFLKFDFNQDLDFDPAGKAFTAFHEGYAAYLAAIRQQCPNIYLEGCASGGMRMDLSDLREFESFWLSDNQSPYHGLRIVKDTMLRMAPQAIERWVVAKSAPDFQINTGGKADKLFAINDSTWNDIRSVRPAFYKAFLTGGILSFSCDLTAFSETDMAFFKEQAEAWKRDRAFWQNAVARILCDTEQMLILQYSDEALREVRVQLVTHNVLQKTAVVRPVLDAAASYTLCSAASELDGQTRTGAQWMQDGVLADKLRVFDLQEFTFKMV